MRPSVSCKLWTPCEGPAVNYTPACFGRPSSAQDVTTFILHAPLSLCFSCFFYCETPRLKNQIFTHRSMGPFITELAWTADELEHKQLLLKKIYITDWVILIFKKIAMKKNWMQKKNPTPPPPVWRTAGCRRRQETLGLDSHVKTTRTLKCPCAVNWLMWLTVTSDLRADGEAANREYPSEEQ